MSADQIYYPEDRIPLPRLIPMGLQQVVAMFGATVLAPLLMGFNPQAAIFFSGIGTLIFIAFTRLKVPSYLGSSFAFIGPVLAEGRPSGVRTWGLGVNQADGRTGFRPHGAPAEVWNRRVAEWTRNISPALAGPPARLRELFD